MDKSSLKITELPALSVASENGFIPIAQVKEENDTYKTTLRALRESIMFENAYLSTATGVSATVPGDVFFVYTDDTKEHVQGWVNSAGGATPLLNANSEQITYGTYALLNKALKDKGAIVQWVYNGGLSNGGEQTFTVPLTGNISVQEVYVDGLRQFKDVGFESSGLTFTLATPVKANQTVVAICFGSDDVEKVNEAFLATYTGPTGASNIGVTGGGTVQSNLNKISTGLGEWVSCTIDILTQTAAVNSFSTRGFYAAGDGGDGKWNATGVNNASRAGKHIITEGKVYNANGDEYLIDINSGTINPLANGAKAVTVAQATDKTTDDFVCLGQALNGIFYQLPLPVSPSNNYSTYTGYKNITVELPPNIYRIGKEAHSVYNQVTYNLNGATIFVYAGKSYSFSATGKRLNGFVHGYNEIKAKWEAIGKKAYWGSVSCQKVTVNGGTFYGDHVVEQLPVDCSSGVGILILNPEYITLKNVEIRNFNWCAVAVPAQLAETNYKTVYGNKFDDNVLDYQYVCDFLSETQSTRFGNFYGMNCENCRFYNGRRGVYRNSTDWSKFSGGIIANALAWQDMTKNVSGLIPDYLAVVTGTGFQCHGSYISASAAKNFNPGRAIVYTSARNHTFSALYTEWCYNNFMISAYTFSGNASRLQGLKIDMVSTYKDDFANYNQIVFESGCFGTISDNGQYALPAGLQQFDLPNGQASYSINSPSRDLGAFRHTGFDFKYGPYNLYLLPGTDWESLRYRPYAKEMFNPYGLQINSGTVFIPWQNPSPRNTVCIWIKDLTGNFDPRQIVAWITAAAQEGSDREAIYKSFAEKVIDYGNGYKMLQLYNKRLSAWDGIFTYGRNANIVITVPSTTPIILKAIEAYHGGIPMFPGGCGNYFPESPATSVISTVSDYSGANGSLGGGLFYKGDMLAPWSQITLSQTGSLVTPSVTSGFGTQFRMIADGVTLESAFQTAFSATVTAVDSAAGFTTISVPAANLPYVAVGIPIWIVSGSSTGTTGSVKILKRVMNADGTASGNYVLYGVVGAVGDTLAIDQSNLSAYSFSNDWNGNTVTAKSVVVSGGTGVANAWRSIYSTDVGYSGGVGVKYLNFYYNGGTTATGYIAATSASGITINAGGNLWTTGNFLPTTTATYTLGSASSTFKDIFSQNAVTVISDRTYKDEISSIVDEVLDVWGTVKFSQWKLKTAIAEKGSANARVHFGIVAQDIKEAFEAAGMDATDYGILIYNRWDAKPAVPAVPAVLDKDGVELSPAIPEQPAVEEGEVWMIRMEECLALEAAYQRRETDRLREKLQSLVDALGHS